MFALLQTAATPVVNSAHDDLIKLAAGALGLVGTVATLLYGWVKDRDTSATRTRDLDEATKRVAFWDGWYKAVSQLDSGDESAVWRERARSEVWNASVAIENLFRPPRRRMVADLPALRRWLLLYTPPRPRAWIPRVIFYGYLMLGLAYGPFLLHVRNVERADAAKLANVRMSRMINDMDLNTKAPEERKEVQEDQMMRGELDDPYRAPVTFEKAASLGTFGFVICFLLGLLFRWWSVSLEQFTDSATSKNKA